MLPAELKHLIVVCCHAIWRGGPHPETDEREWFLESFQNREHTTFFNHITIGLQALKEDPASILCFSGGATKQHLTPLSEGESYLNLAKTLCLDEKFQHRMIAEVFATDSYQNLLFSLTAFRSRIGEWPEHVTVISHDFKRGRFTEEHRKAIRWPAEKFTFIGCDPPEEITSRAGLEQSENANRLIWQKDLYGVSDRLAGKRKARGWEEEVSLKLMMEPARYAVDSEVFDLLRYNGGDSLGDIFLGPLPWDPKSVNS